MLACPARNEAGKSPSIHAEPLTNLGRIDAVLELPAAVYILEFKMSTAQIALDQIRAKGYDLHIALYKYIMTLTFVIVSESVRSKSALTFRGCEVATSLVSDVQDVH